MARARRIRSRTGAAVVQRFEPTHPTFRQFLEAQIRLLKKAYDFEAREALCRDLVQICLVHDGPRHPDSLYAISRLAQSIKQQKRYIESERLQRVAIQLHQETSGKNICWSLNDLGQILERQNRRDEAIKLCRAASEMARDMFGECHLTTLLSNFNVGRMLREKGLLQESEKLLVNTVMLQIKVLGEEAGDSWETMYELGEAFYQSRKYDEGAAWFEKCFRISIIHSLISSETMLSCQNLGRCYEKQGYYMDALAHYQEAIGIFRAAKQKNSAQLYTTERWISRIQGWIDSVRQRIDEENRNKDGYDEESAAWFGSCFRKSLTLLEPDYNITIESCDGLGRCYEEQGRYLDALVLYQETIGFLRAAQESYDDLISEIQSWIDNVSQLVDEERKTRRRDQTAEEKLAFAYRIKRSKLIRFCGLNEYHGEDINEKILERLSQNPYVNLIVPSLPPSSASTDTPSSVDPSAEEGASWDFIEQTEWDGALAEQKTDKTDDGMTDWNNKILFQFMQE